MGVHDPFEALSRILEQYDAHGWAVDDVEATTVQESRLGVTIDVPVPTAGAGDDGKSAFTPAAATVSDDGSLVVEWEPAERPLPGTMDPAVTEVDRSACFTDDGDIRLSIDLEIDPAAGETRSTDAPEHTTADASDGVTQNGGPPRDLAAVRDETVPPYEDTPYLRRLYERCDTFAEMSREIDLDVSAETVRRYMTDAGLHEPKSYDGTEDDAGDRSTDPPAAEQLLTDGFGLPDDVGREELIRAVVGAKTIYEVGRALGIDQSRSRDLLRELGLIDLVRRRLGEDPKPPSRDQVTERLRQRVTETARESSGG